MTFFRPPVYQKRTTSGSFQVHPKTDSTHLNPHEIIRIPLKDLTKGKYHINWKMHRQGFCREAP